MQVIEASEKITFVDFGGDGPLLHFAHANGYPPRVYRRLLEPFTKHFRVVAMHFRPLWEGSNPKDTKSWKALAKDMIQFFKEQGFKDMIGMGHSMGGCVSLFAADMQAGLFKKLIFIDPVFLPKKYIYSAMLMPSSVMMKRNPIAVIASKRRNTWENKQEALAFFQSKKVYQQVEEQVLEDFVQYGLKPTLSGQETLAYPREWEARIYTLPPNIWPPLKRLNIPSMGIKAEHSNVIFPQSWALWQKLQPNATYLEYPGSSHLVPLEFPEGLSTEILKFIEQN